MNSLTNTLKGQLRIACTSDKAGVHDNFHPNQTTNFKMPQGFAFHVFVCFHLFFFHFTGKRTENLWQKDTSVLCLNSFCKRCLNSQLSLNPRRKYPREKPREKIPREKIPKDEKLELYTFMF